jgi:hypothetical protein
VLFLDDIGGDAERQYAVFSYAAVDRLKAISRLRQGVGEIGMAGRSIGCPARRKFPVRFFHDIQTLFYAKRFLNVFVV